MIIGADCYKASIPKPFPRTSSAYGNEKPMTSEPSPIRTLMVILLMLSRVIKLSCCHLGGPSQAVLRSGTMSAGSIYKQVPQQKC